jgi:small subunit ribosomal protein S18
MSALNRRDIKRLRRKRARLKKKLRCRFCPDGCDNSPRPIYVDFKDMRTLRTMVNRESHILSRRRTGNCAKYQRAVRQAVLRARFIGLLAYVAED